MPNERYFAGNSLAAFKRTSTSFYEVTTAARFDPAFVASCITTPTTISPFLETHQFNATGDCWIAATLWTSVGVQSNAVVFAFVDGTGQPRYRLAHDSISSVRFQAWNGSTWVSVGTILAASGIFAGLRRIVCRVTPGVSFAFYVDGVLIADDGSLAAYSAAPVVCARFYPPSTASAGFWSDVLIANYDIRDSHFRVPAINGNSAANTGGTGTYTDVNEIPTDDANAIAVSVAGNKMGQTKAAITVPVGYQISGMVVNARGRVFGAITDGKLGVRSVGGVNSSGAGLGYNGGYEPRGRFIAADPDTATLWTEAGFNGAEIYEEAV